MAEIIMMIAAIGFGMLVSGGVLTVLISVGLVPRFVQRTQTARHELLFENCIILGAASGCLFSIFAPQLHLGRVAGGAVTAVWGLFCGIYEGCVALAIAEMLDALPIFERRMKAGKNQRPNSMRPVITAVALGKMTGSLWYFYHAIHRYGG